MGVLALRMPYEASSPIVSGIGSSTVPGTRLFFWRCLVTVAVRPVTEEPLGIVISRGRGDEPRPTFSAYVWGEEEGEKGGKVGK